MTQQTSSPKLDSETLTQRLKTVTDYVRDCERRVSQGEVMDLQGLDENVVEICDGIAGLTPEAGRILEPQMATLIADLEKLATAMKEQQAKIESEEG